jgi:hypothetical protein
LGSWAGRQKDKKEAGMAKGGMREAMPQTAKLIDDLRSAFGAEYIDKIIRAGMAGHPVFYASENGHAVGTPVLMGVRATDLPVPGEKPEEMNERERRWTKLKGAK